jgi:hypothetical protein
MSSGLGVCFGCQHLDKSEHGVQWGALHSFAGHFFDIVEFDARITKGGSDLFLGS